MPCVSGSIPQKLSAYNLTPADVQAALLRENVELPSGKISGNATELICTHFWQD